MIGTSQLVLRRQRSPMANERLRAAILSSRFELDDVTQEMLVDRKTVERWIAGRVPHKKHRYALARLLAADPAYLWPVESSTRASDLALAELLAIYPVRAKVGNETWVALFEHAEVCIDILVYAGFWLSEDPAVREVLAQRAKSGVQVRLLLGDPNSPEVHQRGIDEGIGTAISAKIANTIHNYRDLVAAPNVEFRLHGTVLYNSIYRADDEMLVNSHIYGLPAHMNPLLHLRRVPGAELFACHADSFDRVWAVAKPLALGQAVP